MALRETGRLNGENGKPGLVELTGAVIITVKLVLPRQVWLWERKLKHHPLFLL